MRVRPKSVWRPGFSYKNGKLYRFDHRRIVVMAPWPDPRAWFRTPTKNWQPTRKWADRVLSNMTIPLLSTELIDLVFDSTCRWLTTNMREQVAQTKYLSAVPPEIQAELSLLTERRWQAMNLFARVPGGFELYRSNPGLAFCLANNWAFHRPAVTHPYRSARSLVGKKQREIVGWLGFPPTDAAGAHPGEGAKAGAVGQEAAPSPQSNRRQFNDEVAQPPGVHQPGRTGADHTRTISPPRCAAPADGSRRESSDFASCPLRSIPVGCENPLGHARSGRSSGWSLPSAPIRTPEPPAGHSRPAHRNL